MDARSGTEDPEGVDEILMEAGEPLETVAADIITAIIYQGRLVAGAKMSIVVRWGERRISVSELRTSDGSTVRRLAYVAAEIASVTDVKRTVGRQVFDRPFPGTVRFAVLGPMAVRPQLGGRLRREHEVVTIHIEDAQTWQWATAPEGLRVALDQARGRQAREFSEYTFESWVGDGHAR